MTPAADRQWFPEAGEWTSGETEVLARAVIRAPSVHNTQPWRMELLGTDVLLYDRADPAPGGQQADERDRAISCGAAVANLGVAVSVLGRSPEVALLPDPDRPELVARVCAGRRRVPSDVDLHRYSAISRRRSYRRPFGRRALSEHQVLDLERVPAGTGVRVRAVLDRGELSAVADLLEYAGQTIRHDDRYRRELALWAIQHGRGYDGNAGTARENGVPAMPWAGLVHTMAVLPDRVLLARRLERETFLLFVTPGDTRRDQLLAGRAMEETWLAAVDAGLVASVMTRLVHLGEVRAGLAEQLGLTGCPQLVMRVGHPSGVVPSPRPALSEVVLPGHLAHRMR
jgi:hypothetical protein